MDYIVRNLEKYILGRAQIYPVILVTGPAGSGKTTMLRHLMEGTSRSYVSLEDLEERSLAVMDPKEFLAQHRPPVLIDDFFYAPELASYLMDEAEKSGKPGDYWLAGSQNEVSDPEMTDVFRGRAAILNLSSLTQAEICGNSLEPFFIDRRSLSVRGNDRIPANTAEMMERMIRGSMPGVIAAQVKDGSADYEAEERAGWKAEEPADLKADQKVNEPADRKAFYSNYIAKRVIPELQDYFESADSIKLYQLLKSCAARCSQLLNVAQMANEAGLNQRQTNDYLTILGNMGIVFYLKPYANDRLKRMIKTPKLYFYDTGLLCHLLKIEDSRTLAESPALEAILESHCMSEIMKSYFGCGEVPVVCYYRNKDSKEVHLLIRHGDYMQPVMFSSATRPDRELLRLFEVPERAGVPCQSGAIVCLSPDFSLIDRDHFSIPAWAL